VFTVLPEQYMLVVSQHVTGSDEVRARLMGYHGAGIVLPQSRNSYPAVEFLAWHHTEVFKKPQREM
jgi:predicted restriction endonuclease